MQIRIQEMKDSVLITVTGNLLAVADCVDIASQMRKFLERGIPRLAIDLSHVHAMSASFCGFLCSVVKDALEKHCTIAAIVPEGSDIRDIMSAVSMNDIMTLFATPAALFKAWGVCGPEQRKP